MCIRDSFLGDDATGARTAARGAGLGVLGDLVDSLDQHALGVRVHRDDLALLASVAAVLLRTTAGDLHEVTLLDLHLGHGLQHLRGERDDLHELLLAQLTAHGPEDPGSARVAVGLEDDGGVLVKLDVRTVGAPTFFGRPDNDRLDDFTRLDVAAGDSVCLLYTSDAADDLTRVDLG